MRSGGWIATRLIGTTLVLAGLMLSAATTASAQSPAAAMLKLLKSGRVPQERLPSIVKLVCERGNADDLEFVFSELQRDQHWPDELRLQTLEDLRIAARERKVIPAGDRSGLAALIGSTNPQIQLRAVELADDWKVTQAVPQLLALAQAANASLETRGAALNALVRLDPEQLRPVLAKLSAPEEPAALRSLAIAVLARVDVDEAGRLTAELLKQSQPEEDFAPLLAAFLDLNQGSKVLAAQLQNTTLDKDVARVLLRNLYAMGRTDIELNQVLSAQAGMNQAAKPPTKEEIDQLVKEAAQNGDAARGELVFRRADLSCMNCHAVSKAGGQIGPDLSAIGVSSPPEYVATSVLDPDQAIKEAYITKTVLTSDGKILQGIVADRTSDALVLKDAKGKKISIPIDDIEDEVEGKSLMPKGLVNFMTHAELLDLIAFLSELGKPGPYAIRSTQRMQRYQVLEQAPASVLEHVPTLAVFEDAVLRSSNWVPAYAKVGGELPLDELAARTHSRVVYVRGGVSCSESGQAMIRLNSAEGATLWLDDLELGSSAEAPVELSSGDHSIIVRIDLDARQSPVLTLQLDRPADSAAEFIVVDGQ